MCIGSTISAQSQPAISSRRHQRSKSTNENLSSNVSPSTIFKLNILIDRDRSVQLTDFGLLSITETTAFATAATSQIEKGSTRWMAPELFESGAKRSRSADVYAFGMTVLEVRSENLVIYNELTRRDRSTPADRPFTAITMMCK